MLFYCSVIFIVHPRLQWSSITWQFGSQKIEHKDQKVKKTSRKSSVLILLSKISSTRYRTWDWQSSTSFEASQRGQFPKLHTWFRWEKAHVRNSKKDSWTLYPQREEAVLFCDITKGWFLTLHAWKISGASKAKWRIDFKVFLRGHWPDRDTWYRQQNRWQYEIPNSDRPRKGSFSSDFIKPNTGGGVVSNSFQSRQEIIIFFSSENFIPLDISRRFFFFLEFVRKIRWQKVKQRRRCVVKCKMQKKEKKT